MLTSDDMGNKLYELVEDDDIRTFRTELISNFTPTAAILIMVRGAVRLEREMVLVDGLWTYRFEDADFEELTAGTWKAWVYATYADGTNGTYPTKGNITIRVAESPM